MRLKIVAFVVLYIVWVLLVMLFVFGTPSVESALGIHDLEDGTGTVIPPLAIGALIVAFVAPGLLFNRVINAKPGWTSTVLANGKQAHATITHVDDTGTTVNNAIMVKIHLRIEPSDEPPFETVLSTLVSRISIPAAGDSMWVKYDPNHKNHVVMLDDVDVSEPSYSPSPPPAIRSFGGGNAVSTKDITKELADLAQMHKNGDLTDAEYSAAKQKLLG